MDIINASNNKQFEKFCSSQNFEKYFFPEITRTKFLTLYYLKILAISTFRRCKETCDN